MSQITRLHFGPGGQVQISNIKVGVPDDHCPKEVETTSAGLEAAGAELVSDEDLGDQAPQVTVVGTPNESIGQVKKGAQRRTREQVQQVRNGG